MRQIAGLRASASAGAVSTRIAGASGGVLVLHEKKKVTTIVNDESEPLIVAEPAAPLVGARVTARALAAGVNLGSERLRPRAGAGSGAGTGAGVGARAEQLGGIGTVGYDYVDDDDDVIPTLSKEAVAATDDPLHSIAVAAAAAAASAAAAEASEGWGGARVTSGAVDETALLAALSPEEKLALLDSILAAERAKHPMPASHGDVVDKLAHSSRREVDADANTDANASGSGRQCDSHRHRRRRGQRDHRSRSRDRERHRERHRERSRSRDRERRRERSRSRDRRQ